MKNKIINSLILFVFGLCVTFSVGQLTASANVPACEGLACTKPSDCGSKCFCNGPSSACYLD